MKFEDFEEIFLQIDHLPWESDVSGRTIFDIAKKNFAKLSRGCSKNHNIIRLVGQSGSGKTTQLLPTASAIFDKDGLKPITFAVRNFAHLHPNFLELSQKFEHGALREICNNFALKCLLVSLCLAIKNGYDIILEVTFLSKEFELFVSRFLKAQNFKILYLSVAVNKRVSDKFIKARKNSLFSQECGRIVNKNSSNFFYKQLLLGLKFYSNCADRIILFNVTDPYPVFDGKICDCVKTYLKERRKIPKVFSCEKFLLGCKIEYCLKQVKLG